MSLTRHTRAIGQQDLRSRPGIPERMSYFSNSGSRLCDQDLKDFDLSVAKERPSLSAQPCGDLKSAMGVRRDKGGAFQWVEPPRQTLQPEATGAVMEVTKWLKPLVSVSRIGDSASVQAVTRVNAEQSSKERPRRLTRQPFRGRLIRLGEAERRDAQSLLRRGSGDSMYTRKAYATREAPWRGQQ